MMILKIERVSLPAIIPVSSRTSLSAVSAVINNNNNKDNSFKEVRLIIITCNVHVMR